MLTSVARQVTNFGGAREMVFHKRHQNVGSKIENLQSYCQEEDINLQRKLKRHKILRQKPRKRKNYRERVNTMKLKEFILVSLYIWTNESPLYAELLCVCSQKVTLPL